MGHALSQVAIRLNPATGSSHLNHKVGGGDEEVPQKKGRVAGRQVELLSVSGVPKECC